MPDGADIPFDQDADWVSHELAGHLEDVMWQCGRQQDHLCGRWEVAIHVIDLFLEAYRAHGRLVTQGHGSDSIHSFRWTISKMPDGRFVFTSKS